MRKLIVAVVVVLALLVGLDIVAKHFVEGRIADRVSATTGVDGVGVDITGFPFLTQVLGNHFDKVEVTFPTLDTETPVGSVGVEDVTVDLSDVRTSHFYTRAKAKSVRGEGLVPYGSFGTFGVGDLEYGGTTPDGHGYVVVSVAGVGQQLRLEPIVTDGTLRLRTIGGGSLVIPPSLQSVIGHALALAGLPRGLRVRDVTAESDGLHLTITARAVSLTG